MKTTRYKPGDKVEFCRHPRRYPPVWVPATIVKAFPNAKHICKYRISLGLKNGPLVREDQLGETYAQLKVRRSLGTKIL